MPPITYSATDIPTFSAAFGSFHVKSSSTSLITILVTVRVLVPLDDHAFPFRHLDGIDLPGTLINRPEVPVNAVFCQEAFVRSVERVQLCIIKCDSSVPGPYPPIMKHLSFVSERETCTRTKGRDV